ncbi:MAG: type VI secretion system-associated FHA domain protein TagH [Alphaproteobacteria bacterium]|nr:type VI secretion system-associated FHA domain protein TagH [Alphaproteobacteria bacterium]
MTLLLVMIRCPDSATPERREVHGGEFTIGRGGDNEWVVPDPERHLSKKHCRIVYSMGDWELYDLSTNGTYINHASEPIGRGIAQKLRHGDRITFGLYEIEVEIEGEAEAPSEPAGFLAERPQSEFMREPPSRSGSAFGDIGLSKSDLALDAPDTPILPPDFDPLAPAEEPFQGPTESDHAPALHGAFRPPQPVIPDDWDAELPNTSRARPAAAQARLPDDWDAQPAAKPQPRPAATPMSAQVPDGWNAQPAAAPKARPAATPASAQVPDDWDAQPAATPKARPAATPSPAQVPDDWDAQPAATPKARPAATPASERVPDDWDAGPAAAPSARPASPAAPSAAPAAAPSPPQSPTQAPSTSRAPPTQVIRPKEEVRPAPPTSRPTPPTPPPAPAPRASGAEQASDAGLAAAFVRGAGLGEATLPDPERTLERIGAAVRATVSGLRQTLMARASIKDEFRIAQTVIRASGNNPLKFSLDDDDALATLLGAGRRGGMPPEEAIAEAFHDLRLHELATVSAMQAAVRTLLEQFAPEAIERKADYHSSLGIPAQKKARSWDAFVQQHKSVTQALSDDFDSVFGKAFARAYEQAIEQLANERKES